MPGCSRDWPGPLAGEGSSGCDLLLQPSTQWSFSLSFAPCVMTHWQNNTRHFGSFHTIIGRFAHPGCTGLKRFPDLACKVGGRTEAGTGWGRRGSQSLTTPIRANCPLLSPSQNPYPTLNKYRLLWQHLLGKLNNSCSKLHWKNI